MQHNPVSRIIECLEHIVRDTMNISIFGVYFYFGNTISMTTMAMAQMGMGRFNGNLDRIRHLYREIFEFTESMERLLNFYQAPECQRNMVNKVKVNELGDSAVRVNGNFSYGVTPCRDYDEKKEEMEKQKKKAEEEEKKRIEALPRYKRMLESLKRKPKIEYEFKYKPRTFNEIA